METRLLTQQNVVHVIVSDPPWANTFFMTTSNVGGSAPLIKKWEGSSPPPAPQILCLWDDMILYGQISWPDNFRWHKESIHYYLCRIDKGAKEIEIAIYFLLTWVVHCWLDQEALISLIFKFLIEN